MLYSLDQPLKVGTVVIPTNSPHQYVVIEQEAGDGCLLRRLAPDEKFPHCAVTRVPSPVLPIDLPKCL